MRCSVRLVDADTARTMRLTALHGRRIGHSQHSAMCRGRQGWKWQQAAEDWGRKHVTLWSDDRAPPGLVHHRHRRD